MSVKHIRSCCPCPFSQGQSQSSHGPYKAQWNLVPGTPLTPPVPLLFPFLAPSSHTDLLSVGRQASHAFALAAPSCWRVLTPGTGWAHCLTPFKSLLSHLVNEAYPFHPISDCLLLPPHPAFQYPLVCAIFILFMTFYLLTCCTFSLFLVHCLLFVFPPRM